MWLPHKRLGSLPLVTKDTLVAIALLDALDDVTGNNHTIDAHSHNTAGTVSSEPGVVEVSSPPRDLAAEQQLLVALDEQAFDLFAALAQLWSHGH
jgi:hypothetical protein